MSYIARYYVRIGFLLRSTTSVAAAITVHTDVCFYWAVAFMVDVESLSHVQLFEPLELQH